MIVAPFSYLQQQAAVVAPYIIRSDAYNTFVKLAVPGTNFGSTFAQSNYYSDISSYVRGSGNNVSMVATGSLLYASSSIVNSGSYNFATDGYTTSIFTEDATTIGVASNAEFGFSNNSWVVEAWISLNERMYSPGAPFHKSIMRDVGGGNNFSCDISFLAQNNANYRMRTILSGTQHFSGTIVAALSTYYHYAWVRSGNNMYMYQNGTRFTPSPATSTATQASIQTRILGGDMNVNDGAKGVSQDIRVTIGSDRGYNTATITPPNSIVQKT